MTFLSQFRLDESGFKQIKIDFKDEKILGLLSTNARRALSELSKSVRLSREGTFYRIRRLENQGLIAGYYAVFDLRDFGYHTYHVFMVLNESNAERKNAFVERLVGHPHTKSVMEYSDRWDIEWVLVARDVQEFDLLVTDLMKEFSDIIIEKHKLEIILGYKSIQLPYAADSQQVVFRAKKRLSVDIDQKDREICRELSGDARLSLSAVGQKIGLSADAVGYRLKRLVKDEIIREFSIVPNLSLLGYHWVTMGIEVRTFDLSQELKFKEYISRTPEILRAVKTLGNWDLMLHIATKDIQTRHRIVKDIQKTFVDVITSYQTWEGYKEYFFTGLPRVIQ